MSRTTFETRRRPRRKTEMADTAGGNYTARRSFNNTLQGEIRGDNAKIGGRRGGSPGFRQIVKRVPRIRRRAAETREH
ncbi:hypothetical protein J6590_026658 [Homalodisca vitripennis]|nr:hypothetical protein J6590_026658 [Homalodisca vitripennis]